MNDLTNILNEAGFKTIEGKDAVLGVIKEISEPGPALCSGYGVFPGGDRCVGCKDCRGEE
jgi:hypothetical protein